MKSLFNSLLSYLSIIFCVFSSALSYAVTVQDSKGTFTLDYVPKRIVVLEYSFVDALAAVNVSPVGIADDKDPNRVLKPIRDIIGDWQSVGTRSQPSLEVIASLKPDLIIADITRHESVYESLKKIAPTLMLPSRHEVYENNLKAAETIGKVLGKDSEMQARLATHKQVMANFSEQLSKQLPKDTEVQFSVALENHLSLHPGQSYAGSLIQALGMSTPPLIKNETSSVHTGLEKLLAMNPQHLIIGYYTDNHIVKRWQDEHLWSLLQAVRNNHVYYLTNPNVWSRSRGIVAAEIMAQDLVNIFTNQPLNDVTSKAETRQY